MKQQSDSPNALLPFETLSHSFLFTGLNAAALLELLQGCSSPLAFEKGAVIYSPHDFRRALGIVIKGRVEILREESGRRVLMNRLETGGIFGAAALYGGRTKSDEPNEPQEPEEYVTEIRAMEPCTVLFLSQEQLSGIMRREYHVAENYIRFLTGRVRFLNERIAGFTGGAADRRLIRYLLDHSDEQGRVKLPFSMVALASALNIGRSSLYRSLDTLTAEGLIAHSNSGIELLDLHRLRAVVE